jgi:serine protease inhibitor
MKWISRMRLGKTLATVAASAAVVGCSSGPTEPSPPLEQLPRELSNAEIGVIDGSNGFAFDLLREVSAGRPGENVFISPLSVSMALGMAMNGTAGTTFDEMSSTLGFEGMEQDSINHAYRGLIDLLVGLDPSVDITLANSVWYREGFPFERNFFDNVAEVFDAQVSPLDFDNPGSLTTINNWVDQATRGKIPRIVDEIRPNHVMFLINAVYFKGSWRDQFDPARTTNDVFTGLGGTQLPVRMMNTDGQFRFGWTPDYQALELPYGNGAFTMVILLPTEGTDVDQTLRTLDRDDWDQVVAGFANQRLMVSMPRFRLDFETSLIETLKAMGIRRAFDPGLADFTRLSTADLFISDVKHKTFVDVNEEGTEAAAATSVGISVTSAPPTFRVDRPFLFAIRERFSGTILFAGRVVEP